MEFVFYGMFKLYIGRNTVIIEAINFFDMGEVQSDDELENGYGLENGDTIEMNAVQPSDSSEVITESDLSRMMNIISSTLPDHVGGTMIDIGSPITTSVPCVEPSGLDALCARLFDELRGKRRRIILISIIIDYFDLEGRSEAIDNTVDKLEAEFPVLDKPRRTALLMDHFRTAVSNTLRKEASVGIGKLRETARLYLVLDLDRNITDEQLDSHVDRILGYRTEMDRDAAFVYLQDLGYEAGKINIYLDRLDFRYRSLPGIIYFYRAKLLLEKMNLNRIWFDVLGDVREEKENDRDPLHLMQKLWAKACAAHEVYYDEIHGSGEFKKFRDANPQLKEIRELADVNELGEIISKMDIYDRPSYERYRFACAMLKFLHAHVSVYHHYNFAEVLDIRSAIIARLSNDSDNFTPCDGEPGVFTINNSRLNTELGINGARVYVGPSKTPDAVVLKLLKYDDLECMPSKVVDPNRLTVMVPWEVWGDLGRLAVYSSVVIEDCLLPNCGNDYVVESSYISHTQMNGSDNSATTTAREQMKHVLVFKGVNTGEPNPNLNPQRDNLVPAGGWQRIELQFVPGIKLDEWAPNYADYQQNKIRLAYEHLYLGYLYSFTEFVTNLVECLVHDINLFDDQDSRISKILRDSQTHMPSTYRFADSRPEQIRLLAEIIVGEDRNFALEYIRDTDNKSIILPLLQRAKDESDGIPGMRYTSRMYDKAIRLLNGERLDYF